MFTGIIEEIGSIKKIKKGSHSSVLTVQADKVLKGTTKIGDSIALNGVCLTVTSIFQNCYFVDVMNETLSRSTLSELKEGDRVNLERAMLAGDRFGGHIVSGHIDGTGVILNTKKDDNAIWYVIETKPDILRYIVKKGSIAIDGISLTVAEVTDTYFTVSLIPHTRENTIMQYKKTGDLVNLENDLIAKYVEKLLRPVPEQSAHGHITWELLSEHGFL